MSLINQVKAAVEATKKFRKVEKDVNLDANLNQKLISGNTSAWVVRLDRDVIDETDDLGELMQTEKIVFGVVIGIKAIRTDEVDDVLDSLCSSVRECLFGKTLGNYDEITLAGSGLVRYVEGGLFWVERFKTKAYITKENLL